MILPFTIELPIRVVSEANVRQHWAPRARRAKVQRTTCKWVLSAYFRKPVVRACTITLTRLAPRDLDTDNLARAFKAVRDGVADALQVKDNDRRIVWAYAQARGLPRRYTIRIRIEDGPR